MPYAFVQQKDNSDGTGASHLTYGTGNLGTNPTPGNLLWWVVNYAAASLQTVALTDTALNTFVQIGSHYDAGFGQGWHWGYAKNIAGSVVDAVLATFGALVTFPAIYVAEYSGLDPTAPYTSGETASNPQLGPGTGTDAVTSTNTPALAAQPAALIGFAYNNSGNVTNAGTGFSGRPLVWNFGFSNSSLPEDKRLTVTTAVAATATLSVGSDQMFTIAAVFKETAASGALSGSIALNFAQAGTLTGAGALAASTAITFGESGTLSGTGALASTTALTFAESGTLSGIGALASTTAISFGEAGTLNGSGALTGSFGITLGVNGTLGQPGALQSTIGLNLDVSGLLQGTGVLSGAIGLSVDLSATAMQPFTPQAASPYTGGGLLPGWTADESELGKGMGPYKRPGQVFGERDPYSPYMTSRAEPRIRADSRIDAAPMIPAIFPDIPVPVVLPVYDPLPALLLLIHLH